MKRKSIIIIISISLAAVSALWFSQKTTQENWQEIIVKKERFLRSVSESGTIQPENKITVNAPIAGRIEKILVDRKSTRLNSSHT